MHLDVTVVLIIGGMRKNFQQTYKMASNTASSVGHNKIADNLDQVGR
jgi:hypothetical protein